MNEDVLKFRKMCLALIADKKLTRKAIQMEMGMSEPSLAKYLNAPVDELLKLRASTLGAMQDFIKHHTVDMQYIGIKPDPIVKDPIDAKREVERRHAEADRTEEPISNLPTVHEDLSPATTIDHLPPDKFRALFCRVWLEALTRGVLVEILSDSGYSGELTKTIKI